VDTHLEGLIAGRRVFVALWLAGNLDHPSFPGAAKFIAGEIAELRRIAGGLAGSAVRRFADDVRRR
jgi:hypothetical protein